MSTPDKKDLKQEAKKYLSIKDLFTRAKPDLRRKLTKYQAEKIRKAVEEVKQYGGGKVGQFVPMGRGRKKYMQDHGLPEWLGGIFLPGGAAVTKNLKYVKGEVYYERGGSPRSWQELNTSGGEEELLDSADKILKKRKRRTAALTANGFVIGGAQNLKSNSLIKKEAVHIFLKYAEMSDNGEMRKHNGALTRAAHPNTWGMGILFETGKSPIEKERARNKFSNQWKAKHGRKAVGKY